MKTIIGLGNPGKNYENTRHNAGVMLVYSLQSTAHNKFKLHKSDKFMNNSGEFVKSLATYYGLQTTDLYIAHDDLDIRLGEYKITKTAPKLHNGILDINEKLKSEDYFKIRIGVDNRDQFNRIPGEAYVLQKFTDEELKILKSVFEKIAQELNG